MNLSLKCFPVGDLPYNKIESATKMMIRLFENSPYLALLPNISEEDNIVLTTLGKSNLFKYDNGKIILNINTIGENEDLENLNNICKNPSSKNLEKYAIDSVFLKKYFKFLERVKPEETIVNFLGPFSFACMVDNFQTEDLLFNNVLKKFIIQFFSVKAMWIINEIKKISPGTKILVIFEESKLHEFSRYKKDNEGINNETMINVYKKIVKKIQSAGGFVGVQCFAKCNWAIPIDSGVDLISFDAFNNPANLNIIPKKVNHFIRNGGYINWGIIPVKSEKVVKSLHIDMLAEKFKTITNDLIRSGVSADLLYSHSTVSVLGDTSKLPVFFAERAIMIAYHLSHQIPAMK